VFLPLLGAVKDLISESVADEDKDGNPESEARVERFFQYIPVAQEIGEGGDEGEEEEDDEEEEEEEDDEEEDPDDEFFHPRQFRLAGYRMNQFTFEFLTERLPSAVDGYTVNYELINSELYVRTRPSGPHERAAQSVIKAFLEWQRDPNNPGAAGDTLDGEGSAGKPPYISQLLTNFDRLRLQQCWRRKITRR
jgi:hypothetical protein